MLNALDDRPVTFLPGNGINCLYPIPMEETPMATRKTVRTSREAPAKKVPAAPRRVATPATAPATAAEPQRAKHKLVRDSFTIPKAEYAVLVELKQRALRLAHPAKKSELLRAGIGALNAMSDKLFLAAIGVVPSLRTGRPKSVRANAK
jgi:hypothetical protein